jgi:hypothetical protein
MILLTIVLSVTFEFFGCFFVSFFDKFCFPQVGRERLSAICLMQKFVHLKSLDTKMQIISAFAVDHVKGSIYIEAERQYDINQVASVMGRLWLVYIYQLLLEKCFCS